MTTRHLGQWILAVLCFSVVRLSRGSFVHVSTSFRRKKSSHDGFRRNMVRNIDLPEALILYGEDSAVLAEGTSSFSLRSGLESLVRECQQDDAAVLAILEETDDRIAEFLKSQGVQCRMQSVKAPNPRDLLDAIASLEIQPKPFGGSAGFGARQFLDPPRPPLPARTVVLTNTLAQTKAARYCGMRVVRIYSEGERDDLADIVVDDIDFNIDDISTPGSFWLNPPHPRDDNGDKVDPAAVAESMMLRNTEISREEEIIQAHTNDEEELQRLLADIDPL